MIVAVFVHSFPGHSSTSPLHPGLPYPEEVAHTSIKRILLCHSPYKFKVAHLAQRMWVEHNFTGKRLLECNLESHDCMMNDMCMQPHLVVYPSMP